MNESEWSELQDLRRQAYGRNGDLALDSEGRTRLRALEDQASARGTSISSAHSSDEARPSSPEATETPRAASSPEPSAVLGRLRRRVVFFWVASIVATALVTLAAMSWVPRAPGHEVATLQLNESERWAERWSPGALATDDFYGLTVVRTEASRDGSDFCLAVVSTESADEGLLTASCNAGAFPPLVQTTVAAGMPAPLITEFGEGRALQFTLDGDDLKVRTDAP